jgi:hypothetical protein
MPMRPRVHAGRAMSGRRRCPFGSANSVSRACCVRAPSSSSLRRHLDRAATSQWSSGGATGVRQRYDPQSLTGSDMDGTGWHRAAVAERSCRGWAEIAPAVGIDRSRGEDWGKKPRQVGLRWRRLRHARGNGPASHAGLG